MPAFYIGGGGSNPFSGLGSGGSVGPVGVRQYGDGNPKLPGKIPLGPTGPIGTPQMPSDNTAPASNVIQAGSVRSSGPAQGYDASYLQNLATAIGGLFSRPQGNLSFNPTGNLSEISPPSNMTGNAPSPGLPSTWLQDALNGMGFNFAPPAPTPTSPVSSGDGGSDNGRGRGGRRLNLA